MYKAIVFALAMSVTAVSSLAAMEEVYRDNVVIVLDASGSMGKQMSNGRSRMQNAKDSLLAVMERIPETTNVGLYVFSGSQRKRGWLYALAPKETERLQKAISQPYPDGGTPLGRSIRAAGNALLEQRADQKGYGTYRLLVVTDGEAGDSDLMERMVPLVLARGITLDVIGLDMKSAHTLATKVHNYRSADDSATLTDAIQASFAEISADDQTALEEQFATVAAIDPELASKALTALAESGNHPLGTTPVARNANSPAAAQAGGSGSSSPAQPQPQPPAEPSGSSFSLSTIIFIIVFIIVALKIFSKGKQ